MKIWTLTVEVYGFGLVTTIHDSEAAADEHLQEEYGQSSDLSPGEDCEDCEAGEECDHTNAEVVDWNIEEHDYDAPQDARALADAQLCLNEILSWMDNPEDPGNADHPAVQAAQRLVNLFRCGHSVCSQNYIDTGDMRCVEGEEI